MPVTVESAHAEVFGRVPSISARTFCCRNREAVKRNHRHSTFVSIIRYTLLLMYAITNATQRVKYHPENWFLLFLDTTLS